MTLPARNPSEAEAKRLLATAGIASAPEAECATVDQAVTAAEIQRAMRGRNAEVPQDLRIEFRFGINLGDIIVAVDGLPVGDVDDMHRLMTEERVGIAVPVTLLRGAQKRILPIVPREIGPAG